MIPTEKQYYLKSFVTLLLFSFITLYTVGRPNMFIEYATGCGISLYLLYISKFLPFLKKINTQNLLRYIFGILGLAFLVFSFFYTRTMSYDGLLWYTRRYIGLINKIPLTIIEFPQPPYLTEVVLALISRLLGQNFVNLFLGTVAIISVILLSKLYKIFGTSKFVRTFSLLSVVVAPVFALLALFEFKTDLVLLSLATIVYILFYQVVKKPTNAGTAILGVTLATAVLIKISFLGIAVPLLFFVCLENLKTKSVSLILHIFLSFTLPLVIYAGLFGMSVPWTTVNIYPVGTKPSVLLDRNPQLYKLCMKSLKDQDFGKMAYDTTLGQKIMQPINYLSANFPIDEHTKIRRHFAILDPGPILYISVWLFPLIYFVQYKTYKKELRYLGGACLVFIAYFFISIRTIYWYLLPVFPITSLFLFQFIEQIIETKKYAHALLYGIYGLVGLYTLVGIQGYLDTGSKQHWDYYANLRIDENKMISDFIEKNNENSYFLDLTPHPAHLVSFANNYYQRVIPSNLYFGSTDKSNEEIYKELKSNNIGYIVYDNQHPRNLNYFGCPLRDIERSKEFLGEYAKTVANINDEGIIYKLR